MSEPTFRIPDRQLLPWPQKETISVKRAAEMLSISPKTVLKYIEAGELRAYHLRPGSPYRIQYSSVIDFLKRVHDGAGLDPRF